MPSKIEADLRFAATASTGGVAGRKMLANRQAAQLPAIAMSIAEVAAALGIGRTSIYKAIAESRLETRKFGRRTLILTASVLRLLEETSDAD
ncbi:helix-turn-helix domain-containing protein [Novosphingobium sp. RD2P27]|uniref:Helix-turn-helix domain-containing protein n=1 Tax=Novosphingobium kalidii TaxID=3230299 RepID=A0ABV2D157_9SPHN